METGDKRVLVCGGRDFNNKEFLFETLDMIDGKVDGIDLIIHGGASGADSLAGEWAVSRSVDIAVYHAKWKTHGKAAGPIRNAEMLKHGRPTLVVAFPGGRGTANMVKQADKKGLMVLEATPY